MRVVIVDEDVPGVAIERHLQGLCDLGEVVALFRVAVDMEQAWCGLHQQSGQRRCRIDHEGTSRRPGLTGGDPPLGGLPLVQGHKHVVAGLNRINLPSDSHDAGFWVCRQDGVLALTLVLAVRVLGVPVVVNRMGPVRDMMEHHRRAREDKGLAVCRCVACQALSPLDTAHAQVCDGVGSFTVEPGIGGGDKPEHYPRELSRRLAQVCNTAELSAAELETLMAATEVGDVWGVGRKIAAQLNTAGVQTVLDLVRADIATLRRQFSVVFEKTVVELRGTPCMGVEEAPTAKQQILVSRSFGKAVTEIDGIVEAVSEFASRAAEKLRLQDSVAGAIQVFIRTSPFRENDRQHSPSLTVPVRPTADSRRLVAVACEAARSMFRPGFNYAKAGVMLMDLQDAAALGDQGELDLFSSQEPDTTIEPDRPGLMQAMDALNRRFGRGAVRIGSTTTVKASDTGAASWAVRQDRRTPRYTTRWDEMPAVRS